MRFEDLKSFPFWAGEFFGRQHFGIDPTEVGYYTSRGSKTHNCTYAGNCVLLAAGNMPAEFAVPCGLTVIAINMVTACDAV